MHLSIEKLQSLSDSGALVVYIHPQRTGGTAFKSFLNGVFGRDKVFSSQTVKKESYKTWKDVSEGELESYKVMAGHFDYFPRLFASRPIVFIGTIRDPYERMVSIYNYCREKDGHKLQELALSKGINDFVVAASKKWPSYIINLQCSRYGEKTASEAIRNIRDYFSAVAEPSELFELESKLLEFLGASAEIYKKPNKNSSNRCSEVSDLDTALVDDISGEDVALYSMFKELSC